MFFKEFLFAAKWQLTITRCKNKLDDDPWRDQDSRSGYWV
jgi:hypothetical protein